MMYSTYCPGYSLVASKYITTHDITTLCELLNEKFIDRGYTFLPEPITEGGIVFKGLEPKHYKSIRFNNHNLSFLQEAKLIKKYDGNPPVCHRWPFIRDHEQVIDEWDFVEAKNLFIEGQKIDTMLKAFHGAPLWTIEELKIFEECFLAIGMKRKGKYPTKKHLSEIM